MGALQVRHVPASAALVRTRIRADLSSAGVTGDSLDSVLLVASELVGNAVRHAQPAASGMLEIEWDLDTACVVIQVGDHSHELPQRRQPTPDEPSGRGLAIVDALAESWGAETDRDGKRVWARIGVQRNGARVPQFA
jgi:serine/threonine-protein kinase RsbW